MGKRGLSDSEYIQKKIRKLEKKLKKQKDKLKEDSANVSSEVEVDLTENTNVPKLQVPELVDEIQQEPTTIEPDISGSADTLPEEFLLALGEEGKDVEKKGKNIRQEIADRWSNIIKMGLKKENLQNLLTKYNTPANFPLGQAPKLNAEITAAVSDTVIKRDKKFEYRQNLTGKVLSCLGEMLTEIMKGNINSLKLIEGINDASKLLCNMHHYDSLSRRHFILTSVQNCVKQAITDVPIDTFLFGENFNERLKAAKAVERSSSTIKQSQTFKKPNAKQQQHQLPSTSRNLNWKSPPQRPVRQQNNSRGGHQFNNPAKRPARQSHQQKPARRR